MASTSTTESLRDCDIQTFEESGVLGPYTAFTPTEMAAYRQVIDEKVLSTQGTTNVPRQSRHYDSQTVYELATSPAIIERVAGLLGPDLLLWRSAFFVKNPGDKAIPWHQDQNYWPLNPLINVSAWLAIDPATTANACVQVVPGSHRKSLPHVPIAPDYDSAFNAMVPDAEIHKLAKPQHMTLEAGQFFLFNEKLLHRSDANRSNQRRLGLAIRVTTPAVRIQPDGHVAGFEAMLVRGADSFGHNVVCPAPIGEPS